MADIRIREVRTEDVPVLQKLIEEMSVYERLPLAMTEKMLLSDGFGAVPLFDALLAYVNGEPAGYALTHCCYSSFQGRGLFLEDLYVTAQFRGKEIGKALLAAVARIASEQECFGIVFNILHWNTPAVAFFRNAGAVGLEDRATFCIASDHFSKLCSKTFG